VVRFFFVPFVSFVVKTPVFLDKAANFVRKPVVCVSSSPSAPLRSLRLVIFSFPPKGFPPFAVELLIITRLGAGTGKMGITLAEGKRI